MIQNGGTKHAERSFRRFAWISKYYELLIRFLHLLGVLKLENILFCENERTFFPETWQAVSKGHFGQTLGRDSRGKYRRLLYGSTKFLSQKSENLIFEKKIH